MRRVLYWILFPACAISVGAFWPIKTEAGITIKCEEVCTMSREDLAAIRAFTVGLMQANQALREELNAERERKHPVCDQS